MARVERFSAQEQIPVEQAQLIDPSAFPADISSAKALEAAGDLANVFAELAIRKQAADDSLAANAASESRTLAELEMQQYIVDHPDPDDWDKGLADILAKQGVAYSSQKFSAKIKKDNDIRQKAFLNRLKLNTKLAQTTQTIENNITVSGKNLIDLLSNDDGSPDDALNIKEQIKDYKEALERKMAPELVAIQMEETLQEAEKLKAENAKKALMNRAVVKPKLMTSFIDAELKTRAKGKRGIPEFALLSNTDLEAVRDYANSVGEKAKSDSKIKVSAAIEDSYARIVKGDTDIVSMITAIQTDPTISDEDSNAAVVKIRTFFSTWNSSSDEKIVTTNTSVIKANKIIGWVRGGELTEDDGLLAYQRMEKVEQREKRPINGTDSRKFIEDIFAAAKTAKDTEGKRREAVLSRREKQVRDAIETQFSLFPAEDIDEILEDFANIAVINFRDSFDEGDVTEGTLTEFKNRVDVEVDDLLRKFKLSEEQQVRAVSARHLELVETFKEQQAEIIKIIASFKREGRTAEAKAATEEAIRLGLLDAKGEKGAITKKKGEGKARITEGLLERIKEQFR